MAVHQYHTQKQENIQSEGGCRTTKWQEERDIPLTGKNVLLIIKGSDLYLETAVSFLTTIVSKIVVGAWGKSRRVLRFCCCTL